ncbi:MAG: hypothetical protein FWD53_07085 [Phycisphaerales bacterium]|nr:hypothetical protein [Phycisphaerales bacterium]
MRNEAKNHLESRMQGNLHVRFGVGAGVKSPGLHHFLRRLMAGDLEAVSDLDLLLSNEQFIAKVKANTARWEAVANYNKVRDSLRNELLLRLAPVVLSLLAALVSL